MIESYFQDSRNVCGKFVKLRNKWKRFTDLPSVKLKIQRDQTYFHCYCSENFLINSFHAAGIFVYTLITSENQRFSDVFRAYRKRPVGWNGLNSQVNTEKIVKKMAFFKWQEPK